MTKKICESNPATSFAASLEVAFGLGVEEFGAALSALSEEQYSCLVNAVNESSTSQ
jgi:hypothetical protein